MLKRGSKMISLKNEYLTTKINEVGAELKRLVCAETEYIWEGKADVWAAFTPLYSQYAADLKMINMF